MRSAAVFVVTGILWFVDGALIKLGADYMDPRRLIDYAAIYVFSASLLSLAFALPLLGRLSSRGFVGRAGLVGGVGAGAASIVNVLEDGLNIEWMFLPFVVGISVVTFSSLVMTIGFAAFGRGWARLLGIVPLGATIGAQGLLGSVFALTVWLVGAAFVVHRRRAAQNQPS